MLSERAQRGEARRGEALSVCSPFRGQVGYDAQSEVFTQGRLWGLDE